MIEEKQHVLGFHLRPKQRAFVDAYIETGGNAPEAALRAYNCATRNSARVIAHRNLHNPKVRAYLDFKLQQDDAPDAAIKKLVEDMESHDWRARSKARDQYFRLLDAYKNPPDHILEALYGYWPLRYFREHGRFGTAQETFAFMARTLDEMEGPEGYTDG